MLKWLLIGIALVIAWYILAPLFTPSAVRNQPHRRAARRPRKRARRKGHDLEVIEGEGRVIE